MLAKTTTHRQHYWLKHVEAADLSDGTIAEYAAAHDVSFKGLYQWKTSANQLLNRLVQKKINGGYRCQTNKS